MKTRIFETKLSLNKTSVANLDNETIKQVKGGVENQCAPGCNCCMCMTDFGMICKSYAACYDVR